MKQFIIILALGLLFINCQKEKQEIKHSDLPPGYRLLCSEDGKVIAVMPGGTKLGDYSHPEKAFDNRQDAIDRAWQQYNFKYHKLSELDKIKWVECDSVQSTIEE